MNLHPAVRWLVLTILVGASAWIVATLTSRSLRDYRRFVQAPSETTGTVTPGVTGSPELFYRFEAGGRSWENYAARNLVTATYRAGDRLPVFYLAADPSWNSTVRPTPGDLGIRATAWWLAGGMVVAVVGLVAHRALTKAKRESFFLDTTEFEGNYWYF